MRQASASPGAEEKLEKGTAATIVKKTMRPTFECAVYHAIVCCAPCRNAWMQHPNCLQDPEQREIMRQNGIIAALAARVEAEVADTQGTQIVDLRVTTAQRRNYAGH